MNQPPSNQQTNLEKLRARAFGKKYGYLLEEIDKIYRMMEENNMFEHFIPAANAYNLMMKYQAAREAGLKFYYGERVLEQAFDELEALTFDWIKGFLIVRRKKIEPSYQPELSYQPAPQPNPPPAEARDQMPAPEPGKSLFGSNADE